MICGVLPTPAARLSSVSSPDSQPGAYYVQCAADPVSGRMVVINDQNMAGLLASEPDQSFTLVNIPQLEYLISYKFIANRGLIHLDASVLEMVLQAAVAHHRRHDRVAEQLPAVLEIVSQNAKHVVPINIGCRFYRQRPPDLHRRQKPTQTGHHGVQ